MQQQYRALLLAASTVLALDVLMSCAVQPKPVVEAIVAPTPHVDPTVQTRFQASITYTKYGIPHITAKDWASLGYGDGYASAEDNLCVMADAFVTFAGERSRFFGPKAQLPHPSTLGNPANLEADFFFRHILSDEALAKFRAHQPAEIEDLTSGYAAGYSRYVREIRDGALPARHAECRSAEWLRGITSADVYRRMMALVLAASSINFITPIANAVPPGVATAAVGNLPAVPGKMRGSTWTGGLGSNMIGFGNEATGTPHGLLFGNPHWFWDGIDRFHQVHLRIPGEVDVEGASILGVPMVLIGFNKDVAWSHTVSTAARFTLYRLKLVNGKPTDYMYDGKPRHMRGSTISVEVRYEDGTLGQVSRTLYDSHLGPMLADGWSKSEAYTLRDANIDNDRSYRNWLRWNRATSLDEFMDIQKQEVAIPWVNTIATGRDGRVWYADISVVPNLSDARRQSCKVGERALDGSRSQCEWEVDATSPQSGILPAEKLPHFVRQDYAANMNDSFWLSNANAPLEGFPSIIGSVKSQQSFRTRLGHLLVKQRLEGSDGLDGDRATSETVRDMVLNSRSLTAELFLDDLLASVCKAPSARLPDSPRLVVDLKEPCSLLAQWDRRGNPDSIGAQIWDKIWEELEKIPADQLYRIPFDPAAPLETPSGLNTASPRIAQAVAAGVDALSDTSVSPDAARREYQYLADAAGAHIPLAGGCVEAGYFTAVCTSITRRSISLGEHGNSYMQVVGFSDDGVEPYTLFLPSQSTDPASPHFRDYTRAYSQKAWLRAPFTETEVSEARESSFDLQE